MRRNGGVWQVAIAVIVVLFGTQAWAQPAQNTSVVVIIDSGSADLLLESTIRTTIEVDLEKRGYQIVEDVNVAGETPSLLLACSGELSCIQTLLSGIPAQTLIFLSLRADEESDTSNFKIVARQYEVQSGHSLARVMRRCATCKSEIDLAPFTEEIVDQLLAQAEKGTKEAEARSDRPKTTPKTLAPARQQSRAPKRSIALAFAAITGGLVGIAAGSVLVEMDAPMIVDGQRQPSERRTLVGGAIAIGAGTAMVGVGLWLWLRPLPVSEQSRGLVVQPAPGGGSLLWSGEF